MMRLAGTLQRSLRPMVKAGDAVASWRKLPMLDAPALLGVQPVLILSPHPDDESLGCGGLIADCQSRAQPVYVVVLTDGSGSHPLSREYPAARLAALRALETQAAMAALGLQKDHVGFIGLPDGRAPSRGRRFRASVNSLVSYARARNIGTVCTTWRGDPHHDHRAAYRFGAAVARALGATLLSYPVWGWTLPPDVWVPAAPQGGARVDIAAFVPAKQRAISCYRSQMTGMIADDPSGFRLSPEFLANFSQPFEVFLKAQ